MKTYSNRQRLKSAGGSLVEVMFSVVILSSIFTVLLSLTSQLIRSQDKIDTETVISNESRRGMDEVLLNIRGSDEVRTDTTINGLSYQTGSQGLILNAPAFNPASSGVFITGSSDLLSFRYDSASRTLRESIEPAVGSIRPSRSEKILARNVFGLTYTYRAREQFTSANTGTFVATLAVTPLSTPTAFVNGVAVTSVYTGVARTVSVPVAARGADVQIVYPIDPAANGGSNAVLVGQVDMTLTLRSNDSRNISRTFTMTGSARLRNRRN